MEETNSTPWESLREGANAHELRISNVERGGLLVGAIHPQNDRSLWISRCSSGPNGGCPEGVP
jgi:hypothetical protein